MANNTLLILPYRGGSTLFLRMIGDALKKEKGRARRLNSQTGRPSSFAATTKEDCAVLLPKDFTYCNRIEKENQDIEHFVWWHRVTTGEGHWSFTKMKTLPIDDWNVRILIRDGRNHVASWYSHVQKNNPVTNNMESFLDLCRRYKRGAQYHLQLQKEFAAQIIKFEKLVANPVDTIELFFAGLGLTPERSQIEESFCAMPKHSSFENRDFNNRWKTWPEGWIEIFLDIAGPELEALGYAL